jgi:hypothetical protein
MNEIACFRTEIFTKHVSGGGDGNTSNEAIIAKKTVDQP